jgi:hypothetical protein
MNTTAQQSLMVRGPAMPQPSIAITQESAKEISKQLPDTAPGPYYVSVMKDGGDYRLLSGPYDNHADALIQVDPARAVAEKLDVKATWYYFGTVRMAEDFKGDGILQKMGYSLDCKKVPS